MILLFATGGCEATRGRADRRTAGETRGPAAQAAGDINVRVIARPPPDPPGVVTRHDRLRGTGNSLCDAHGHICSFSRLAESWGQQIRSGGRQPLLVTAKVDDDMMSWMTVEDLSRDIEGLRRACREAGVPLEDVTLQIIVPPAPVP